MKDRKKSVFGFEAQMPKERTQDKPKVETDNIKEAFKQSNQDNELVVSFKQNVKLKHKDDHEKHQNKGFLKQFHETIKKPTIEETHKRQTFLIEKQLLKRLNQIAKRNPKGFKTHFINYCIKKGLDELDK